MFRQESSHIFLYIFILVIQEPFKTNVVQYFFKECCSFGRILLHFVLLELFHGISFLGKVQLLGIVIINKMLNKAFRIKSIDIVFVIVWVKSYRVEKW